MRIKRSRAAIVVGVVLALLAAGYAARTVLFGDDVRESDAADHSVTEPTTGVVVSGAVRGGSLTVTPHSGVPGFSTQGLIVPVGHPVKVEANGTLDGEARISFPYPESASPTALFVARYNDELQQWIPQGGVVDAQKRTLTAYTTEFSYWTLARYDEESSAKQVKYVVQRNFYNSTLYAGFSGLFSQPPPTPGGCTRNLRNGIRTMQADVTNLMRGLQGAVCIGRSPEGKYLVSVGNTVGYPVLLQLPQAVKVLEVVPRRTNVYGVFVENIRKKLGDSALVLRGGQRVVLEIDPEKVPDNTLAISARMDFGHTLLDLSATLLQVLVPLAPRDGIALKVTETERFATLVNCYTAAGHEAQAAFDRLSAEARVLPLLEMHNAIMTGLLACSSELLAFYLELLTDPVKWLGDQVRTLTVQHIKNKLPDFIKGRFDAMLTVWRDAGVFTQLFSAVFTLIRDGGFRQYGFTVTVLAGDERAPGGQGNCADDPSYGGRISAHRWFPRECRTPLPTPSPTI